MASRSELQLERQPFAAFVGAMNVLNPLFCGCVGVVVFKDPNT